MNRDDPETFARVVDTVPATVSGHRFARGYADALPAGGEPAYPGNPLWEYFQRHREGRGVWKWEHYFPAYERHFARFVGRPMNILEIGIYSGGSLEMWRTYFGEKCHVYGVDIEPACRSYEDDHVSVFIGDQEDRAFWRGVREKIEAIDIVIDDGGHTPGQQQVTLEELLPFVRPGGVYVCEDVHGRFNHFTAFVAGLVDEMNHSDPIPGPLLQHRISPWQASIQSLHVYPHMVVIEKHDTALTRLVAPKHGTEWQPFL